MRQPGHPCAADDYRFGRWQSGTLHARERATLEARDRAVDCFLCPRNCRATSKPGSHRFYGSHHSCAFNRTRCTAWEYQNATCGPPFSPELLCRAFGCRNVLLVGDSTVGSLHQALAPWRNGVQWAPSMANGSASCPAAGASAAREHFVMCENVTSACPKGVTVSYWRHDHLDVRSVALDGRSNRGSNCDGWWDFTPEHYQLALLSRGAHLNEYGERKGDPAFHAKRAHELADVLLRAGGERAGVGRTGAGARALTAVYVLAHWGMTDFVSDELKPLPAPAPASANYSWDLIPRLNAITAETLKRRLGGAAAPELVVVDPTRALASRRDCRSDPLHVRRELYLASTWRMVQNALLRR